MRYALGIEYDGSNYCGWQKQTHSPSVQERLEKAVSKIANEPVEVVCAGRTDTGVNATNQIVHFDTNNFRKDVAWTLGVNTNLPKDIAVRWVKLGQVRLGWNRLVWVCLAWLGQVKI